MESEKRRWPWIAQQTWRNVLFIHFPVPYQELRKYIPEPLTLETNDGQAWIGIVLFEALYSRLRQMPKPISFRYFLQLNVRTYVNFNQESGVFFFSLDANRKLPVLGARFLSLPYYFAHMEMKKLGNNFHMKSNRIVQNQKQIPSFDITYKPNSRPFTSKKESLVYWFTERYCFWTIRKNKIYKGPISHDPWTLQQSSANISIDHDSSLFNHFDQKSALTHYSSKMYTRVHPFEQKGIYVK